MNEHLDEIPMVKSSVDGVVRIGNTVRKPGGSDFIK